MLWLLAHTPGQCVIADKLQNAGREIYTAETLIIVSRCVYGGFSAPVKKVLDRAIPGISPFFIRRRGETHHAYRFQNEINLRVIFYGEVPSEEQALAQKIVTANGTNLHAATCSTAFLSRLELKEEIQ